MTKKEIEALIATGEGLHLDLKRSISSSHADTLVAFANANSGKLNLPSPEYLSTEFFTVTLLRNNALLKQSTNQIQDIENQLIRLLTGQNTPLNASLNALLNALLNRQLDILKLLQNKRLNRTQLAEELGATSDQIRRDIENLKEWVEFKGSKITGGYEWSVLLKQKIKV